MDKDQIALQASNALLGLGAMAIEFQSVANSKGVSLSPAVQAVAVEYAAQKVQDAVIDSSYTRGQKLFASKVRELPEQTQINIGKQLSKFSDGSRYIAALITASGGTTELMRGAPEEEIGVTNFDKGDMPSGVNIMVEGVSIEYGFHASKTNPADITYSNVLDAAGLPTAIANSEFEVVTDTGVIIPSTLTNTFFATNGTAMGTQEGIRVLAIKAPRIIVEKKRVGINIRTPKGIALPTGNHFLRVSLIGPEISVR
jgi:hypothetical protein